MKWNKSYNQLSLQRIIYPHRVNKKNNLKHWLVILKVKMMSLPKIILLNTAQQNTVEWHLEIKVKDIDQNHKKWVS